MGLCLIHLDNKIESTSANSYWISTKAVSAHLSKNLSHFDDSFLGQTGQPLNFGHIKLIGPQVDSLEKILQQKSSQWLKNCSWSNTEGSSAWPKTSPRKTEEIEVWQEKDF